MRKTRSIGVVVTTIADPFVAGVVSGIEGQASTSGYSTFLAESHADPVREQRVVQSFAERRVDGIIVTSSRVGGLYMPVLELMQVPVVLVNNQHPGEFIHSVLIDNTGGASQAAEHLAGLGHQRIAYIGDRGGFQSDAERLAGFCSALEHAGLRVPRKFIAHGDGGPDGGDAAMRTLLELRHRPTAVVCYNDMTALGALRAIRSAGLRVPDDVSLTGFDDLFLASYTAPPLTTIRQPMREMGLLAMNTLLRLMAGEPSPEQIRVPAELILRESTAPPKERS